MPNSPGAASLGYNLLRGSTLVASLLTFARVMYVAPGAPISLLVLLSTSAVLYLVCDG